MALQVLYATSGDGIAIFHRSGDSLSLHGVSPAPSGAFTTSPNCAFLFVANDGHILSFAVDPATGDLSPVGSPAPFTDNPAYLACDRSGRFLLHASYGGHSCAVHAIGADGQVSPELQRNPTSLNAHAIATDPTNRFAYVPCIAEEGGVAGNAIHGFSFSSATGALEPTGPPLTPAPTAPGLNRFGTRGELGPRHLVFHPYLPLMYTSNEQGNSVSAWRIEVESGALSPVQTVATVPDDCVLKTHCSEIVITPTGKHILAPNRGHDSVAVFEVDDSGRLRNTAIQPLVSPPAPLPTQLCLRDDHLRPQENLAGSGPLCLNPAGDIVYVGGTEGVHVFHLDVHQ